MSESPGRRLKTDLAARKPLIVVNIDYANGSLVEFLGRNGADVIFIDCEQGDTAIQSIRDLARASHIAGVPAIVRLYSDDPAIVERYMFQGVDGIVVPRLKTPADAQALVETVRYCFPADHPDKTVVVQIEDIAAVDALDGFLAVAGIDCFFVGPVDLSKSMGHGGIFTEEPVARVIDETLARISAAGKTAGMLAGPDNVAALTSAGVSFLYLHTNDFIRVGAARVAQSISADGRRERRDEANRSTRQG